MLRKLDKFHREQGGFYFMEELVPEGHLLRQIDKYVDFDFIYDLVEPLYDEDNGRPAIDPVLLIKLPLIQYLCGIRSMRQTVKDCEVNTAYRWFLGLDLKDPIPNFTTFGKNYSRRFKETDLFEQIFFGILDQAIKADLVSTKKVFIDGTHIKAHANNHKYTTGQVVEDDLFYVEELKAEIREERVAQERKALKSLEKAPEVKEKKMSTSDPEAGWYHKGEHKQVFAYCAQVACDEHGWVLGFTSHPGNLHDSRTFKGIYTLLQSHYELEMLIMDAGYKTPAIAHELMKDKLTAVFPYKRPMTKKGFFKKYEYSYDEEFDTYTCPNQQTLSYTTTTKEGYRQYKSNPKVCATCPFLVQCTQSKNHVKVISRHLWERDLAAFETLRKLGFVKEIYAERKETIERIFGTAKEFHGLRYTNQRGREKLQVKLALTFACLNMKKLAKIMRNRERDSSRFGLFFLKISFFRKRRENPANVFAGFVCSLSQAQLVHWQENHQ